MKSFHKLFESMLTKPAMPTWGAAEEQAVGAGRAAAVAGCPEAAWSWGPQGAWSW